MNVQEIAIRDIQPPTLQPRLGDVAEDVAQLAASIARHGLISPLTVLQDGDTYRLLAGHRRLHAVKALAWASVPCVVVDAPTDLQDEITIAENLFRRDLSDVEEAYAFAVYLNTTGKTHEQLATALGKERTYVTRRLLLLDLDDDTLANLEEGTINLTQALMLRQVDDPAWRLRLIHHCQNFGANNRVFQMWVADFHRRKAEAAKRDEPTTAPEEYTPPREVFMACDRCGTPTSYDLLRSLYACPDCRRQLAAYRLTQESQP